MKKYMSLSIKYNLDYNVVVGVKLGQKSFQFPQCKQFQRKTKNILKSFFLLQRFTFEGLKEKFLRFWIDEISQLPQSSSDVW